ncbi:MAG: ribonuclease H-like domain-containing protein [Methanobacteriaceae archaeon]|nr:ribonuclease H-like domain-containing protein [Methanobacteriaceae archaeon]
MSTRDEPQTPHELKEKLLLKYQSHSLEDLPHGYELENSNGTCFCLETKENIKIKVPSPQRIKKIIIEDLKLLNGIGQAKEVKLKSDGYKTLKDMCEHPLHGPDAETICKLMEDENFQKISDWISEAYFPSHHLNTLCMSARDPENFLFMDIETLGLDGVPLILIGVAQASKGKVETVQYLLRDLNEEKAALESFVSLSGEETLMVSFNGRGFDAPFIKRRLKHHQMNLDLPKEHLDLLYPTRRLWKSELPNCKLQTIEKYLFGIERVEDVPGYLVPDFYKTYLKEDNIGPLIPIIEHNREDVLTLIRLLSLIQKES